MLVRVRHGKGAVVDFLGGGGRFVFEAGILRQTQFPGSATERVAQRAFDFVKPLVVIPELVGAGLEDVSPLVQPGPVGQRTDGILVEPIPTIGQLRRQVRPQGLELRGGDLVGQRTPAVSVTEQDDEIGAGCHRLAAGDLRPANPHGALVQGRFMADAPAQVNRLETPAPALAVALQAREHALLQRIPLRLQIAEGRADEDPDGSRGCWHGELSLLPSAFILLPFAPTVWLRVHIPEGGGDEDADDAVFGGGRLRWAWVDHGLGIRYR